MLESDLGRKLRGFVVRMDDTYGDGTCFELARVHSSNVYHALNYYSHNEFIEYSPHDIYSELIINELLCDENENDYVCETKRLVGLKQSAERVFKELDGDFDYRSVLIHSYIKHACEPFSKKLSRIDNQRTLDLIQKISAYQLNKESEKGKNKAKEKKKEFKFRFKNPS